MILKPDIETKINNSYEITKERSIEQNYKIRNAFPLLFNDNSGIILCGNRMELYRINKKIDIQLFNEMYFNNYDLPFSDFLLADDDFIYRSSYILGYFEHLDSISPDELNNKTFNTMYEKYNRENKAKNLSLYSWNGVQTIMKLQKYDMSGNKIENIIFNPLKMTRIDKFKKINDLYLELEKPQYLYNSYINNMATLFDSFLKHSVNLFNLHWFLKHTIDKNLITKDNLKTLEKNSLITVFSTDHKLKSSLFRDLTSNVLEQKNIYESIEDLFTKDMTTKIKNKETILENWDIDRVINEYEKIFEEHKIGSIINIEPNNGNGEKLLII